MHGEKSYGKGVAQRVIKVSGKNREGTEIVQPGILTITDSRIYGPHDEVWDDVGLQPSSGENPAK